MVEIHNLINDHKQKNCKESDSEQNPNFDVQSLKYETGQTGVFWDVLWHKKFVCMNCETYLALECYPKSPWPTAFEKSKINWPNLEKLQFKGSKIEGFLLVFEEIANNHAKMLQSCFL